MSFHHGTISEVLPRPGRPPRRNEWHALAILVPYLMEFKGRVAIAMAFLVTAKLANVGVPLMLKDVVDRLDQSKALIALPLALLAAYGLLRLSARSSPSCATSFRAGRTARRAPHRAHGVPPSAQPFAAFPSRAPDRRHDARHRARLGGISTLLRTCCSRSSRCSSSSRSSRRAADALRLALRGGDLRAVAFYIAFTVGITEWRMDIRRSANELDSRANSRAIDSLINYETVKYFNNEEFEARRYDESLRKYEGAAVKVRGVSRHTQHRDRASSSPSR
jgi:ATP-binding cassette subfamily B protein